DARASPTQTTSATASVFTRQVYADRAKAYVAARAARGRAQEPPLDSVRARAQKKIDDLVDLAVRRSTYIRKSDTHKEGSHAFHQYLHARADEPPADSGRDDSDGQPSRGSHEGRVAHRDRGRAFRPARRSRAQKHGRQGHGDRRAVRGGQGG